MYTKKITYTDFDGQERTETLQFNLTKAEWMELQFKTMSSDDVQMMLDRNDTPKLVGFFKELLLSSYGEKSADGRRFVKSPEISKDFESTQAYSDFFMQIASDPNAAAEFLTHVLPKDVAPDADKIIKEQLATAQKTTERLRKENTTVDVIDPEYGSDIANG